MEKNETATSITTEHYSRPEIRETIQRIARDDDNYKAGNGDFLYWYKRFDTPNDDDGKLILLSRNQDYDHVINRYRTLYWTLNYFYPEVFDRKKINENDILGSRSETASYTLGIDIDKINDIHNPDEKGAVEAMGQFFCNELKKAQPKSVYAAFSGGGIYVYLHHGIWGGYFRNADDRDYAVYLLINAFNKWIADKSIEFFNKYPQYKDKCKADALNNSKRVFKTIFSVHKKHPYAVIPLDIDNIKIVFDDAKLPLRIDVIERGREWYLAFDKENNLKHELAKYEDEIRKDYNRETFTELRISEIAIKNIELFPPCIKNIINTQSFSVGKTRAISFLATFLGQAGWSEEEGYSLFNKVATNLKAETSNIFQSFFKKMSCPRCEKVKTVGAGFPNMEMGELNICFPDSKCKVITNPIFYIIPKKAKKPELAQPAPEVKTPEDIITEANKILTEDDPVDYILSVHQKLHVGDEYLAKSLLVSIGCQSVLNSDGLHPKVSGESGKGKSHCCKAMSHLIPDEWRCETTLSDKAIYYMDMKPGTVIFSDDVNLSENLEGIIKRATSNYQIGDNYKTLDAQRNLMSLVIPPRVTWWLTSVDDNQSLQLLNRTFGGGIDDSIEQDRRVVEFQINQAVSGEVALPENREVHICREILRDIKKHVFVVKIPFMVGAKWHDAGNRRNFPIFMDMIKAFAILRYKQRPFIDGCLIAMIDDYMDAKELYSSRADNQRTKLTDAERKVCEALRDIGEADSHILQNVVGITQGRLSQIMSGKNGHPGTGLLEKVKGLSCEKVSVKVGDTTTHKTIYRLNEFNVFDCFGEIIELSQEGLSTITSLLDHYYTTITPLLTRYILYTDSDFDTTISKNERAHDSVRFKIRENPDFHGIVRAKRKNANSANSGSTNNDSRANSGKGQKLIVPPEPESKGNSGVLQSTKSRPVAEKPDFQLADAEKTDKKERTDSKRKGNSGIINEALFLEIEEKGVIFQSIKAMSITNSNVTEFSLWFCDQTKYHSPEEIKRMAEKIFKLTPKYNIGYLCSINQHNDCGGFECGCECHKKKEEVK